LRFRDPLDLDGHRVYGALDALKLYRGAGVERCRRAAATFDPLGDGARDRPADHDHRTGDEERNRDVRYLRRHSAEPAIAILDGEATEARNRGRKRCWHDGKGAAGIARRLIRIARRLDRVARRLVRILDGLPHLLPHLIARRVGGGSG
jgi:hypothetical protein